MATTNFGNGSTETKTYDTMTGDLLDIWTIGAGAATLTRQSYTYDGLGRKAFETLVSGATRGFSYDGAGQLTSEVKSGASGYTANYTYDNAGNRLSKSQGGATDTYTYDAANKLVSVAGSSVSKAYAYDNAGNVVAVTSGTDTTNLTWDGQGRLSAIDYPTSTSNTFSYNGLGQRVGKLDSGGTFGYTLADDAIDSNVLADGQASYQYGAGLVSEVRGGTSKVYHADSLGTTRAMSDGSGNQASTLETDAFGNTVSVTGSTPSPFGFAGQHGYQTDVDSGLMKLGYRYYDASVGRFLSRDPAQAGYNWYTYCNNDPVNAVDPEGLEPPTSENTPYPGKHKEGNHWLWKDGEWAEVPNIPPTGTGDTPPAPSTPPTPAQPSPKPGDGGSGHKRRPIFQDFKPFFEGVKDVLNIWVIWNALHPKPK